MIGNACLYDAYAISNLYDHVERNLDGSGVMNMPTGRVNDIKALEDNILTHDIQIAKSVVSYNNESFVIYNLLNKKALRDIIMYGVIIGSSDGEMSMIIFTPWDQGFKVIRANTDIDALFTTIDPVRLKDESIFMKIAQRVKRYKAVSKEKYDSITNVNLGLNVGGDYRDYIFAADNEGNTLVYDEGTGVCEVKDFSKLSDEDILIVCVHDKAYFKEEDGYEFNPSDTAVTLDSIPNTHYMFNGVVRDMNSMSMDELYGEAAIQSITSNAVKKIKRLPKESIRRMKGFSNKLRKAYGSYKRAKEDETRERIINDEIFPLSDKIINFCTSAILSYGAVAMGIVNPLMGLLIFAGTKTILRAKSNKKREMAIHFLKKELEMIDEKISDAKVESDKNAKYRLMRIRNKIEKKIEQVRAEDVVA